MEPLYWIILIVLALVFGAAVVWVFYRSKHQRLRAHFGPEYDKAVRQAGGSREEAEAELTERKERVSQFDIHPLTPDEHDRFATSWRSVQERFVDEPAAAVVEADRLIREVMRARGYPVGDFDQQAADLSVNHPVVVENYRAARDIAQRSERDQATTEELRQATVHYRTLFDELLESGPPNKEVQR